jgi:hypothetical protein
MTDRSDVASVLAAAPQRRLEELRTQFLADGDHISAQIIDSEFRVRAARRAYFETTRKVRATQRRLARALWKLRFAQWRVKLVEMFR